MLERRCTMPHHYLENQSRAVPRKWETSWIRMPHTWWPRNPREHCAFYCILSIFISNGMIGCLAEVALGFNDLTGNHNSWHHLASFGIIWHANLHWYMSFAHPHTIAATLSPIASLSVLHGIPVSSPHPFCDDNSYCSLFCVAKEEKVKEPSNRNRRGLENLCGHFINAKILMDLTALLPRTQQIDWNHSCFLTAQGPHIFAL